MKDVEVINPEPLKVAIEVDLLINIKLELEKTLPLLAQEMNVVSNRDMYLQDRVYLDYLERSRDRINAITSELAKHSDITPF